MQQLEMTGMEPKEEVFYVRCRKRVKQVLHLQMHTDGFSSMSDWFEQFVIKTLVGGRKWTKKPKKKKKKKAH